MLGQELARQLTDEKINFIHSGSETDITSMEALRSFYENSMSKISGSDDKRIDFVVNCAAYTKVDLAEDEKEKAFSVNQEGSKNIAKLCRENSLSLIHVSTDYVFDGSATSPIDEECAKSPIGVYGQSKSKGEDEIEQYMTRYYILRTSWLYGFYGKNFVYTMTKLMNSKEELKVVSDQRGTPTNCATLAKVIVEIIKKNRKGDLIPYGIYNVNDGGETSWFYFAQAIQKCGAKSGKISGNCRVNPCATADYPTKAKRPAYSVLSTEKIQKALRIRLPGWEKSLKSFFKDKEFNVI